ncbi:hypothetical protein ACFYO9_37355 [Streptomyces sp. NPDC005863]|uniref:hypothetical protein n=1 Tax=Streptomyces sp. NPDC005863 TaxID=3364735 RepID=UPI003686C025
MIAMAYRGTLATSLFNDRQIRAKEYSRWRQCHSDFARGRRREIVDRYKAEIERRGAPEQPIWLDVDDKYGHVYVGDGHHRAVALMELGIGEFAFHWRLISKGGWFTQPPLECVPFPYHLLGLDGEAVSQPPRGQHR